MQRLRCPALILWIAGVLPAFSQTRQIVLLYDERTNLPGMAMLDAGFVRGLTSGSRDQVEIYREAMDLSRFDSGAYRNLLRDHLRAKYAAKKIDVAVTVMEPALDFLLSHREEVFPGAPIVFCGADRRRLSGRALPSDVTGVFLKREFSPTLEIALSLHPETDRIVVVAGTSDFDTRLLEQAREEFRPFEDRLAFTYLTALPMPELLAQLSRLPPKTLVLYSTVFRDGAGQPFVPHEVAERVSAAASVPVYGFHDQFLGRGIVGGRLYGMGPHGEAAAGLVLKILAGKKASELPPIEPADLVTAFDWRQLQRWNISEGRLPPGSEIHFRQLSAWDQYRWQIVSIVAILLVQLGLIIGLLFEHRRRLRAEITSHTAAGRLAQMNRVATAGELSASIAHEVNQPLASIAFNGTAALRLLAQPVPDLDEARSALQDIVDSGHRASRVIKNVHSMFNKDSETKERLDVNEVVQDILRLVRIELKTQEITVQTALGTHLPLVLAHRGQLQQVILNLVRNAADAMRPVSDRSRVLRLKSTIHHPDCVLLSFEDSGTGIDPKDIERIFESFFTTKSDGIGMGLSICRSIIQAHNGRLWASTGLARGAVLNVQLPAAPQDG